MKPLDTIVFETSLVRAARFRCYARDSRFRDSGPAVNCAVVFPRTAVWLCYSGQRPFVADPSLATIYNPGQEYTRKEISRDGDRCEWFGVSPEIAREIAGSFDPRALDRPERPFAPASTSVDHDLYLVQRALFTRLERNEMNTLQAEEIIIGLVTTVIGRACENAKAGDSTDRDWQVDLVERCKVSLLRTLYDRRTLGELASELDVSPFHLCRVFRTHVGHTLHEYRTDLRLRMALEKLTERTSDLSRVALESGFSSHSHFTAAVRRKFGKTPSALRQALTRTTIDALSPAG
jgi:AraC family transcriptional regulator